MKTLGLRQFGDPILRKKAKQLSRQEIDSAVIQSLIKNMRHTLVRKKLGVAVAAPQVGKSLAIVVIAIRPTEHRPNVEEFDLTLINPVISKKTGKATDKWEGCLSSGDGQANLFAKVKRYSKVTATFIDDAGVERTEAFDGLVAQVIQHEVDHLNGILFVDHVTDPTTYMTMQEYRKRVTKA